MRGSIRMPHPILETVNLDFQVADNQILKDINLQVEKGEFATIIGPSGSGKSTLLKLIGSLQLPTSGKIMYEGKNIYDFPMTDYRQEVSYFFQNALLFGRIVEDNLRFPYQIRGEEFDPSKSEHLLEKLQLPKTIINKSINDISGGEKQRIALVRNLLFQPKVLLLDEITSSLDLLNREIVQSHLRELQQNKDITILTVTHNKEEIELADRIIEIKDGKLV